MLAELGPDAGGRCMCSTAVLVLHGRQHKDGAVLFSRFLVIVVLGQVSGIAGSKGIVHGSLPDLEREPCSGALVVCKRSVHRWVNETMRTAVGIAA